MFLNNSCQNFASLVLLRKALGENDFLKMSKAEKANRPSIIVLIFCSIRFVIA